MIAQAQSRAGRLRSDAKGLRAVWLIAAFAMLRPGMGYAGTSNCPAASAIPQLTIHDITDSDIPVFDRWQVFLGRVPLSDAQLAQLAGQDLLIERTHEEMQSRGFWVYTGLATAALGTAISSAGWAMYGRDAADVSSSLSLVMALGGLALGVAGTLVVTESIQSPLEPHLAPTPRHRLSRDEMRSLVALINRSWYRDVCLAVEAANPGAVAP